MGSVRRLGRGFAVRAGGCGGVDAGNVAHDCQFQPAKGAIAMSRRKVIVKRLNAIQNFGAMDVLCTDKTGTLTRDNIFLEHHLDVSGVKAAGY